jgi:hypothetical protein
MMLDSNMLKQIDAIMAKHSLLNLHLALLQKQPEQLKDILRYLIKMEFTQELEWLKDALTSPETFEQQLKARCDFRSLGIGSCLSLEWDVNSPSNALYRDLVIEVLKPQTMAELLVILYPPACTLVTIRSQKDLKENPITIATIYIERSELTIEIIKFFPSNLYDLCFQQLNPWMSGILVRLFFERNQHEFDAEQKQALLMALKKHFNRFFSHTTPVAWAIKHYNELFLELALIDLPENQRLSAVREGMLGDGELDPHVAEQPELLAIVFKHVPKAQHLELVSLVDKKGKTFLHRAYSQKDSIKQILGIYPENKRLKALLKPDTKGNSSIQSMYMSPEALEQVLSMLAGGQRYKAITSLSKSGHNTLGLATVGGDAGVEKFPALAIMARLILPQQQCDFLRVRPHRYNELTVAEYLISSLPEFPQDIPLVKEYVTMLATVHQHLGEQNGFFTNPAAARLKNRFLKADSFDAGKHVLLQFLLKPKHQTNALASSLLNALVVGESKTVEALSQQWQIAINPSSSCTIM